jgi:hypothetical protein
VNYGRDSLVTVKPFRPLRINVGGHCEPVKTPREEQVDRRYLRRCRLGMLKIDGMKRFAGETEDVSLQAVPWVENAADVFVGYQRTPANAEYGMRRSDVGVPVGCSSGLRLCEGLFGRSEPGSAGGSSKVLSRFIPDMGGSFRLQERLIAGQVHRLTKTGA